jgi:hypothetical protein
MQNNPTNQESAIRQACTPLRTFIDTHIDAGLQALIRHIASSTVIPVYQQARECRDLIATTCLGDPTDVRARLIKRFKMGKASTVAEVILALDNFMILIKQINLHYETVLRTVDEARTHEARKLDPAAPPVMKQCASPPTDADIATYFDKVIDHRSAAITSITTEFTRLRAQAWSTIVTRLKPLAEARAAGERAEAEDSPVRSHVAAAASSYSHPQPSAVPSMMPSHHHPSAAISRPEFHQPSYPATFRPRCSYRWDEAQRKCQFEIDHPGAQCPCYHGPSKSTSYHDAAHIPTAHSQTSASSSSASSSSSNYAATGSSQGALDSPPPSKRPRMHTPG